MNTFSPYGRHSTQHWQLTIPPRHRLRKNFRCFWNDGTRKINGLELILNFFTPLMMPLAATLSIMAITRPPFITFTTKLRFRLINGGYAALDQTYGSQSGCYTPATMTRS
jgi:hypothetical protein